MYFSGHVPTDAMGLSHFLRCPGNYFAKKYRIHFGGSRRPRRNIEAHQEPFPTYVIQQRTQKNDQDPGQTIYWSGRRPTIDASPTVSKDSRLLT